MRSLILSLPSPSCTLREITVLVGSEPPQSSSSNRLISHYRREILEDNEKFKPEVIIVCNYIKRDEKVFDKLLREYTYKRVT